MDLDVRQQFAALEARLKKAELLVKQASQVTSAIQGSPAPAATISIPHNDSWLFEDNVDATHPANLRYVIASNVQRIVSARLSIHLAPYRTYSNFSVTATGGTSNNHNHSHNHSSHAHSITLTGNFADNNNLSFDSANNRFGFTGAFNPTDSTSINGTTPTTDSAGQSADHTHTVSGSSFLGVSEGATATGVTILFDGVDQTSALGGPFNSDQIELNVRPFLTTSQSVWHVIAMQPTGLGRIEAHLRLAVYVAAGQLN